MAPDVRTRLAAIVGEENLRTEGVTDLDPGLDPGNFGAGTIVYPASTAEVAAVVKLCNETATPIVPHGGRTSLARAATSSPGQIVLDLARMNRIETLDSADATAICEAGVTLTSLAEAALPHGLSPGIDIGARDTATLGGMTSTNAGGGEAFRRGVMRHRILGLEAVLPDGSVLFDLKSVTKANEGYDVKQLLIGAEGTLGIITRLVIKLVPHAEPALTFLAGFASATAAVGLFRRLETLNTPQLLRAEIMWRDYVASAEQSQPELGSFCDAQAYVLFEMTGPGTADKLPAPLEALLADALEAGTLLDAIFAKNETERAGMWRLREDSWAIQRAWPHGFWYDISVPLSHLDDYVAAITESVAGIDPALRVFSMGHLGDGNLHLTISNGRPCPELHDAVDDAVYAPLAPTGGSFSAEHGIGLEKKAALATLLHPGKLALQRILKATLDPNRIMNPGKVI